MDDRSLIEDAIFEATGQRFSIRSQEAVGGGCINDAFRLRGDARSFFVKCNRPSFRDSFEAEALALKQLSATRSVRTPQVLSLLESENQAYLILEYIETRSSRAGDWAALGEGLAALHEQRQPFYGWQRDNFIGSTPQTNPQSDNWIVFFREHRLKPMLAYCERKGFVPKGAKRLLENLDSFFVGYEPWPSLLHGDLWSGNVSFDTDGKPFIYDPASYYGDREADIAFTEFFGGFSREFYAAYNANLSLDSGYATRKTLYNLYHCLNHVYLFGGSYTYQAEQMTAQLLAEL